ncbi:hypothetical protein, partial [Pseudomonas sp. GW704-E3]
MVDFDFKRLTAYLKRNLVGMLVVATIYAGVGLKLWDVQKDQEIESKRLAQERVVLNDLKVEFEKEKASSSVEQAKRDLELQKREFLIARTDEEIAKQQIELGTREQSLLDSTQRLQAGQRLLSQEQVAASVEEKIQTLMNEFSELGVSLDDNYFCLTGEYLKRYYSAKAKFSQIYTLAKANLMLGKYGDFIEQNKPQRRWYY